MEIAFETKNLRTLCENEPVAKGKLESDLAHALRRRLADLRAAVSIADVLVGNPRVTERWGDDHIVIDLVDDSRVVVCANHTANPISEKGEVDWVKVSRIKIVRIERLDE